MSKLKALIFDVDGTLAETEEGHRKAFNQTFRDYKLDWHWSVELYRELLKVTGGKERMLHYARTYRPDECPEESEAYFKAIHQHKTARYVDLVEKGEMQPRPGIVRLINEAQEAGLKLAIATTTSPANVSSLLKSGFPDGADCWFDVIAAGDMVKAKKPAADVYFLALEQLGLAPDECLALEDSRNGVLSSVAAGIPVLVTRSEYTKEDDFNGAAAVFDCLGDDNNPATLLTGPSALASVDTLGLNELKYLVETGE